MAITRLSGGTTPPNGSDPRTFPAIWNDAVDDIEAAEAAIGGIETSVEEIELELPKLMPAGAVQAFAMSSAPNGFLKANGAAVSRATFSDLFAAIGTTFGAGDGSTTFLLPDMRGEFPRGWSDGRAVDTGRAFGSAQADAFKSHNHFQQHTGTGTQSNQMQSGGGSLGTTISNVNTANTGGNETRPRNIALLFCIKF